MPDIYTADPSVMVHDCTFYITAGHDEGDTGFVMRNWYLLSSTDMVNWSDNGAPVMSLDTFSWADANAWAGQMVQRNGKFYWYVPVNKRGGGMAIGVAVSDSPKGPFKDAIGAPLIDDTIEMKAFNYTDAGQTVYTIDPTVFIDDNGQAYLVYGGFWRMVTVQLEDNMIALKGQMAESTPRDFFEAPYLTKRNGLYYMVYAAGSNPATIDYATAASPTGPWTYRGRILEKMPALSGQDAPTSHPAIAEFAGQWYLVYHISNGQGGGTYRRQVAIDKLTFNSNGTINPVTPSSGLVFDANGFSSSLSSSSRSASNSISSSRSSSNSVSSRSISLTSSRSSLSLSSISSVSSSAVSKSTPAVTTPTSYPDRDSVGYKPANCPDGLKVVNSAASAPAGTSWNAQSGYLDATGSATLDCVRIIGGLYISGSGTFKLTNSIVEGGASWFILTRAQSSNGPLLIYNSTLRWRDGKSVNPSTSNGAGVIHPSGDQSGSEIIGNDISGNPDGIQLYGNNWIVRGNWIHNLARVGIYPDNTHNDGIQVYGGTNLLIENNRIELGGFDGEHQNGALFFQVDALSGARIIGNYLEGGGFIMRLEAGVTGAIVRNNVFGPPDKSVVSWPGYVLLTGNASVAEWTNNCEGDANGVKFEPCRPVTP